MQGDGGLIANCPHCGSDGGVIRNVRMYGWAEQYWDRSGEYIEMSIDRTNHTNSKTLRCPDCYKIRRDVRLEGMRVVMRGAG